MCSFYNLCSNFCLFSFDEHLFHEKITIKGCGDEPTDVVIQSEDGEGYFVFVDSEQLTLENLTLEGARNFEGALVVNGGSCQLNNVHLKCDPITRGKLSFFGDLTTFGESSKLTFRYNCSPICLVSRQ